jgi:hypothetical protein
MTDDKTKTGGGDRKRVAEDQGYELTYFARKHGLSTGEAREIIRRVGNDRDKLNAEAEKIAADTRKDTRAMSSRGRGRVRTTRNTKLARATVLGGAVAVGALVWSRRDQIGTQIGKLAEGMGSRGRGTHAFDDFAVAGTTGKAPTVAPQPQGASSGRSQADIAEEALTLKETGARTD